MSHVGTEDYYPPPEGPDFAMAADRATIATSYLLASWDARPISDLEELAREWHMEFCENCGWDEADTPIDEQENPWLTIANAAKEQYEDGLALGERELWRHPRSKTTVKEYVDHFRRREHEQRERAVRLESELRAAKAEMAEMQAQISALRETAEHEHGNT